MQSLRNRQIREVLDEDMNINRRVFDREKEQVKVFGEVLLPKKTRDIEAETSVDKLIESINKILENKLTSLEYLLSKITGTSDIGDAEGRRSYNSIVSNGDFITAFNQLVRVYTTQGISRNSQEIIKVKFQEIKPNIDAIIYGIEELVQYLFESGKSDKEIFQLVRSQAVYQIVKDQLYRGASYKIIEQGDIEVSIKEVLSELSEIQRAELKDISGRDITERSLLKLPIEIGEDEDRIKALEAEMGFKLPGDRKGELAELGRREKEQAFSMFGEIGKSAVAMNKPEFDAFLQDARMRADTLIARSKDLKRGIREAQGVKRTLIAQQQQLILGQLNLYGDPAEMNDEVEIPLADDINAKTEEITRLRQELDANTQAEADLKTEVEHAKQVYERRLEEELYSRGELPLRKKKVKSLIPEDELVPAPEVDEKAEAVPALPASAKKPYYTKAYLDSVSESKLRLIASSFNYTPQRNTDRDTVAKGIIKRQPFVKPENRQIIGLGRGMADYSSDEDNCMRGGNFSHYGIDDEDERNCRVMRGGAYQGMIVSNPMLWRGRPQRVERPYHYSRVKKEHMNRDYGHDDDDDFAMYNFTRGGSMYDDRRNDIYHIQRHLKRGY